MEEDLAEVAGSTHLSCGHKGAKFIQARSAAIARVLRCRLCLVGLLPVEYRYARRYS